MSIGSGLDGDNVTVPPDFGDFLPILSSFVSRIGDDVSAGQMPFLLPNRVSTQGMSFINQ